MANGRSSGSPPPSGRNLEDVARAVIRDCGDAAEPRGRRRVTRLESDEVVVVEFVLARLGQPVAAGEELDPGQRRGGLARLDALHLDDQHVVLERPQPLEGEVFRALGVGQRPVAADRRRDRGEGLDAHLAAHALRRAEPADEDEPVGRAQGRARPQD